MKELYLVAVLYVATLSVALNKSSVTDFPTECPAELQNKIIYLPHENDCTKFYSCYMGTKGEPLDCPFMDNKGNRLHFNPVLQVCDWPRTAGCKLSIKSTSASITPTSPSTSSSSSSSSPPTVSSNSPISPTSSSNTPTTTSSSSSPTLPTSSSSSLSTTTSSSSPASSSLPSTISSDSPTSSSSPFPPTTTSSSNSPASSTSPSSLPPTTTSSSSSTSSTSSSTSFPETTTSSSPTSLTSPSTSPTTPSSPTLSTSSSNPSTTTTSSSSPVSPTSSSSPPSTTLSDSPTSPTSSSSPFPPPTTLSSNSPASSTSPSSSPLTTSPSSTPILPSSSSLPPITTSSSSSTSLSPSSPPTTPSSSTLSTSSSNPSTTTTSSSSPVLPTSSSSPPSTTSSDSPTSPTSSSSPFPPTTTLSSNSPASSTSPSSSPLTTSPSSTPILPSSSSLPPITTSSSSSTSLLPSSPPTTSSSPTLSTSSSNPSTTTISSSSSASSTSSPSTISSSSSPILPSSSSPPPTMPSLPSSSVSSTSTTIPTAISATTTKASEKPRTKCPSESSIETVRIAHQCLCNVYYECMNGDKIRQTCPIGMHFDYEREVCDWSEAVNCVQSISTRDILIDSYQNKCYQEGRAFQHEIDCSSYYLCVEGEKILKHCMAGLHFNVTLQMCDYPTKASCDFIATFLPATNLTNCPSSSSTEKVLLPHECDCAQYYECINGNQISRNCPNGLYFDRIRNTCNQPNDAKCPYVCPCASSTKKVLLPHECNCGKYYECVRGNQALRDCPNNLHFDYIEKICKHPDEAICATSTTKPTTTSTDSTITVTTTTTNSTVTDTTTTTNSTVTDTTITTDSTVTDTTITTDSTVTDTTITTDSTVTDTTITTDSTVTVTTTTTDSTITPTDDPENPRKKCPPKGSTAQVRIAHPWVCYLYYECVNGNKEQRMCPIGKHFDYIREVCDWSWKVNCIRPIPTHDISIDSCYNKCSPEGRAFRHETDCSSYYLCSNGKKNLKQCTAGLHFNITLQICNYPYKSCDLPDNTYSIITQNVCPPNSTEKIRFPHNCKCTHYYECVNGKKSLHECPESLQFDIIQKTCNDPDKSGCASMFPKSTPMPIISTTKWPKEPNETTTENPLDPSKCIGTCPEEDPDHAVLLPNEDCKKFCMCSNGIAWVQPCPEPLYFDSKDKVCKYKRDAICGKRLFNQDRVSMHHRMFDEKNSLQSLNKKNNDDQGIHDNSLFKHIYNFDDKTTTDETTTENPLDPSKCIGTCPEIDPPKAVLLPNEDCKKFCMCSNGIAWVQPCPEPLYFDSKDKVCKIKRDAICGKRLFNQDRVSTHHRIFDEKNSLQSLNKENNDDQGIYDNSLSKHIYNFDDKTTTDETTTENPLDPSKCIGTCPEEDPDHAVLLPNEDCKKFCMCSNGIAWVQPCPEPLYFDSKDTVCKNKRDAICGKRLFSQDRVYMYYRIFDEKNSLQSLNKENNDDQGIYDNSLSKHIYNFDDKTTTDETTTENPLDPSKCIGTCPEEDPDRAVLLPNEDCKKFCMCSNGIAWVQLCPEPLYFDSKDKVCKIKRDAICGKRLFNQDRVSTHHRIFDEKNSLQSLNKENNDDQGIYDNSLFKHIYNFDDKTTTENPLDPSKCIGTCPEIDPPKAVLLPNEDCKKFCMCSNGIAWVQPCPEPLYFDSKDKVCKIKRDAICGKRLFNQDRVSTHHRIFDEKNSLQSLNKENNDDQGIHDNSLSKHIYNFDDKTTIDETTTENPLDPSKCIGTCPEIDPPKAVLLPNEDCKKFCMCSNGIAWVQPCPEPLYFDSKDTVCKNKRDAICGKRLFSQDRVYMHYRIFDEKNSLQSLNKENNDDQGIYDNSLSKHIYNFDDKTTTDETTTENPLDPSKCIGTCPEIDPPKAVLLPNEDCKKFCMCSNGIAWVQPCPEPLYFDSKDKVCKIKRDAICGKRLFNQDRVSMHHRMFDEKNSLQSLNKENNDDQGIHDNSLSKHIYNFDDKTTTDETTTKNPLDPSKCIGTCPEEDPDRAVLLPNEDCKKFCMCSNGIAWVQPCPEPLYFDSKDTVCKNKRDAVCGKRLFNQDRVSMHHRMFNEKNSLPSLNKENNDDQGIYDNSLSKHIYNFDDKTTTDETTTENPLDPSKCIGTCPEIDPPKAVLLPNEDCKKFCMCSNGIAWVQLCPEPLYFDSKDTVCKNKRDAVCGKRSFN